MTTTAMPPDALLAILLRCPEPAREQATAALAEATALAQRADPEQTQLAVIASWLAYQCMQTTSQDTVEWAIDELTAAAIVVAGDALAAE